LLTLNAPIQIGKCTPRGTCIPGWEPLLYDINTSSLALSRFVFVQVMVLCSTRTK